jgi:hypothetical protein
MGVLGFWLKRHGVFSLMQKSLISALLNTIFDALPAK